MLAWIEEEFDYRELERVQLFWPMLEEWKHSGERFQQEM